LRELAKKPMWWFPGTIACAKIGHASIVRGFQRGKKKARARPFGGGDR